MVTRRPPKTPPLARQAAELAVAVPQVIAHRLTRLALAGPAPSARDRQEFRRMGAEKAAAFAESWNAMATGMLEANQTLMASFMRGFWSASGAQRSAASATRRVGRAVTSIVQKGLAPVHRCAVANAKRLSRTQRQ
jgi:hypothetical protein